jgi:hypothetical protein
VADGLLMASWLILWYLADAGWLGVGGVGGCVVDVAHILLQQVSYVSDLSWYLFCCVDCLYKYIFKGTSSNRTVQYVYPVRVKVRTRRPAF